MRAPQIIAEKFCLTKDCYILFLGRLVPEKGVHLLIDAFKKVNTDKKLVIVGGTSDTDAYVDELMCSANEDSRIIFAGFAQGEVLEEFYSNAYLYILQSSLEGMPLSLLEAMSYGNACVVSDIPECTDVVGDKAFVVKPQADELQKCIQALCNDEKTVRKYKAGAADYICEKYNWEDVVNRTLELYDK